VALSSYSELQTAVGSWLNRSDLTSNIPDFIKLAEASFNRVLRTRNQIKRATSTVSTQFVTQPTDLLELYNIQINSDPIRRLEQVSLTKIDELKEGSSRSGKPLYFSITGADFELYPSPDTSYTLELVYYSTITSLSDTNTSNFLLTNHPDIYLYGTLVQAEPYLMNDERIGTWGALLGKAIEELRVSDERSQTESGTLVMRATQNLDYGGWK
tara:strand:- start:19742 stop:20380 length:639 start_codon:yes stop_codon:yes gene_type:complete